MAVGQAREGAQQRPDFVIAPRVGATEVGAQRVNDDQPRGIAFDGRFELQQVPSKLQRSLRAVEVSGRRERVHAAYVCPTGVKTRPYRVSQSVLGAQQQHRAVWRLHPVRHRGVRSRDAGGQVEGYR